MYKELYQQQVLSLLTYILITLFITYGHLDSETYRDLILASLIWIIGDFIVNRYYKKDNNDSNKT